MQRSYFHFIKLYLKFSQYILIRNGMLIDQKIHFMITFFKIIPCKRFYALLALKVGCQNIEGDLNILGLSSLILMQSVMVI